MLLPPSSSPIYASLSRHYFSPTIESCTPSILAPHESSLLINTQILQHHCSLVRLSSGLSGLRCRWSLDSISKTHRPSQLLFYPVETEKLEAASTMVELDLSPACTPSNVSPTKALGFLDLPAEIRITIYQFLFSCSTLFIDLGPAFICRDLFHYEITATCHGIRAEAIPCLNGATTLVFNHQRHLEDFPMTIPQMYLQNLESICIIVNPKEEAPSWTDCFTRRLNCGTLRAGGLLELVFNVDHQYTRMQFHQFLCDAVDVIEARADSGNLICSSEARNRWIQEAVDRPGRTFVVQCQLELLLPRRVHIISKLIVRNPSVS